MLIINSPVKIANPITVNAQIEKQIIQTGEKNSLQYVDEILDKLTFMLYFFKQRIIQKKAVINVQKVDTYAIAITKEIYEQAFPGLKKIPTNELKYFSCFLLSGNVLKDEQETDMLLDHCTEQVITNFERFSFYKFAERESLKKDLILHLKPTFYRVKFQTEWLNPMLDDIKSVYPDVFDITKKSIQPFERMVEQRLSENEISYIAIIFGGYLYNKSRLVKKKTLAIVCSKGVGTSRILEHQLRELFGSQITFLQPISLREYELDENLSVDFIVSTIPVISKTAKVFIVSPILTNDQKEMFSKEIAPSVFKKDKELNLLSSILDIIDDNATVRNKEQLISQLQYVLFQEKSNKKFISYPTLNDLLSLARIQVIDQVTNWQEAVKCASDPLLTERFITESYQRAMIENIKRLGAYIVIAPGIAFPHATREDGAFKTGMSLLKLRKPVAFSSKEKDQVSLIFVLSIIDDYAHINALSELTDKIRNKNFYQKIMKTYDKKSIKNLIEER